MWSLLPVISRWLDGSGEEIKNGIVTIACSVVCTYLHTTEGFPQQRLYCTDATAEVLGAAGCSLWFHSSCWPERTSSTRPNDWNSWKELYHVQSKIADCIAVLFISFSSLLSPPFCSLGALEQACCGSLGKAMDLYWCNWKQKVAKGSEDPGLCFWAELSLLLHPIHSWQGTQ